MMHRAFGTQVLVVRGRGTNLFLLALERSIGLLLRSGFRDKATTIRAKARIDPGHLRQIAGRGRDPRVMGHLSPNH